MPVPGSVGIRQYPGGTGHPRGEPGRPRRGDGYTRREVSDPEDQAVWPEERRRRDAALRLQTKQPESVSRGSAGRRRMQNGGSRQRPPGSGGGSREPGAGHRTGRGGSRLRVVRPGSVWHGPGEGPRTRSGDSRRHPGRHGSESAAKAAGLPPAGSPPRRPDDSRGPGSRRFPVNGE